MILARYAQLTAAVTFLLLIAGSLVTSTDSGLAVPDWPLSYGTWFPPMVGGIRYEHGHRMIAALVGLMIAVLAIWLGKVEPRRWVRRLGYAALTAVILQALLGGLTVLLLLPSAISIAHALIGQAVWCLVVCLAVSTSPRWEDRPENMTSAQAGSSRRGGLITALLAALQLLLGAVIRHTGYAVGWHAANAVALIWFAGRFARRVKPLPRPPAGPVLWRGVRRLTMLLGVQLLLGLAVWTHRAEIWLRTAHVGIGALILAQAVVLAWETWRRATPGRSPATWPMGVVDPKRPGTTA